MYIIITAILLVVELVYFRIADKCNIIDKPNERSSHSSIVLRGGGVIFVLAAWIWAAFYGLNYPWFLIAVTIVSVLSFIDDIRSLSDSVRLVGQFIGMGLLILQLFTSSPGSMIAESSLWTKVLFVIAALIVCVGATNIYNFMDGINGITPGYSFAILIPLFVLNREMEFVDESLIVVVLLANLVFSYFNFRPKGKAKCFAGDVGSVGIAFILLFMIGMLIMRTGDITWLIFMVAYGVDGCCTIVHRVMLHENLGEAHRKHVFQLMANELKIGHMTVTFFYMILQLVISLVFVLVIPDTVWAHWVYLGAVLVVLVLGYVWFMRKYYHLHAEYLASLKK
jgi:UDP-N-acetylmuramyl pentapeptide phosphotransferase/UDP-N-acetylglucosamine-1-phosphate transferase